MLSPVPDPLTLAVLPIPVPTTKPRSTNYSSPASPFPTLVRKRFKPTRLLPSWLIDLVPPAPSCPTPTRHTTDHPVTFAAYSSFITAYDNANYSTKLPAANAVYSPAALLADEREAEERKLAKAADAKGIVPEWAYAAYVGWECEVKRPRVQAVRELYRRMTAEWWEGVEGWETWIEFGVGHMRAGVGEVCERAVRAVPGGAGLWAAYMRVAVST